jgi:hypothetical protein
MYDYIIVFLSAMYLTTIITKWYYFKTKEPSVQVNAWTKEPSKIPTISQEKHEEYIKRTSQWKTHPTPDRKFIYSESFQSRERVPLYRVKSMEEWRDFERKNEDSPLGSWIHFDDPTVLSPSNIRVTFAIVRVDTPERWDEYVYFYHKDEDIPKIHK